MKLNTVLLRGVNEEEIPLLLQFAGFRGVEIRFIEFMPVGMEESFWRRYFLSEDEVIERLKREYPVNFLGQEGIVRYYRIDGIQAGFISTVSYPFCHQCSRLRITSNGKIYLCLFDREGYDIRRFLRPEFQEEELKSFLPTIAVRKPEGFVQWKRLGTFPGRSPVMKQVGG
jgi:cyclic pyranopterin phosphate synthase